MLSLLLFPKCGIIEIYSIYTLYIILRSVRNQERIQGIWEDLCRWYTNNKPCTFHLVDSSTPKSGYVQVSNHSAVDIQS